MPASDATQAGTQPLLNSNSGLTSPVDGSVQKQYGQQHAAKVTPLPVFADTTQPAQAPTLGAVSVDSSASAVHMPGDSNSTAAQNRSPDGSDDGQSDGGSYDSTLDSHGPFATGPMPEYQSVIRNPLARNLPPGVFRSCNRLEPCAAVVLKAARHARVPRIHVMNTSVLTVRIRSAHLRSVLGAGGDYSSIQRQPTTAPQSLLMALPNSSTALYQAVSTGACDYHVSCVTSWLC